MKNDYFENDGADKKRTKRKKQKKGRKTAKGFLIFLAMVVVALAVFVVTIKLLAPEFDFSTLVPKQVHTFVDEKIKGNTTTTAPPTTTKPTTTEKPTAKMMDYLEFDEFKMDTGKQGNSMGNLLNGGKVATDYSYIYHITDDGLYRLGPESEDYTRIYKSDHVLSSLNLRGDYIYFVDEDENVLYKMQKGSEKPKKIAESIKFAYVCYNTVYCVTTENDLCIMGVKKLEPKTLYSAGIDELRLVGVSVTRVFFAVTDSEGRVHYLTIAKEDEEIPSPFRETENGDSKLVMENGFMYFYDGDTNDGSGKYPVCRQKFGSELVVTLAKDGDGSNYIAVHNNRLYYPERKDGNFMLTEVNMNSGDSRYLMIIKKIPANHQLKIFQSYDYDFVIGNKREGGMAFYRAGCVYTASTHYMKFKDGKWAY